MRYRTAGAFRQALEDRLRDMGVGTGLPLTRLRKMIAFDRFLARLVKQRPESWIIKGGLALQLRLGDHARTTKDIDASTRGRLRKEETTSRLRQASAANLGDWFEFEVGQPSEVTTGAPLGGFRFPIRCLLDGRDFERFHLDVGGGDKVLGQPEVVTGPPLLEFVGIKPSRVPCYPMSAQIAEKVHAYTRPYLAGGSSRVRDLVDILLIASMTRLDSRKLYLALQATFEVRATHTLPSEIPKPPSNWSGPYKRLRREVDLRWPTIKIAGQAAAKLLNPVLQHTAKGLWDPTIWAWKSD